MMLTNLIGQALRKRSGANMRLRLIEVEFIVTPMASFEPPELNTSILQQQQQQQRNIWQDD